MTSGVLEFQLVINNQQKYFVDSHSFISKNKVAEHIKTDDAPYDMWIYDKEYPQLTVTETLGGVKTDYKYILRYYQDVIKNTT